ncbi:MAG: AAA family ATPase [Anaerolineae bacterium]
MIPLRLYVRNFMCYRDNVPPLDFSGIHLACLAGANGHGKSALLDAITWALWGKARAKRDDELIHQGQAEMEVEFTFSLEGQVYRILRKRDSTKQGRTMLDLQVRESEGRFRSIAGSGIRNTQEAINRLLRLDYETFTNSAFLVQGKADAFTTRSPAERKQVLGDILGLRLYDEYEQRAKEKAKEKDRQLAELEGLVHDIDRELARQPEYEAERDEAQARVDELSALVKEAEAALRDLEREQQILESQQSRLRDLDRRLADIEQELTGIEAQIRERQQRLNRYETALARRPQIEDEYTALLEMRRLEAAWNERLSRYSQLQSRQRELDQLINSARRELDLEAGRLNERIRRLERQTAELDTHERELDKVRASLAVLMEQQAERDAAQERIQVLGEEAAELKARNEQLKAEMDALEEKRALLERESGAAQCPLCGQTLSEEHRDRLLNQIETEGKAMADSYRSNSDRRREIETQRKDLEARIRQLDQDLADLPGQQRREAQLEQSLAEARQAADELQTARADLAALEQRLLTGDYAPVERAELARVAGELKALDYDPDAHQQLRTDIASRAESEEAYRCLQTALEHAEEERAALQELKARQDRWRKTRAEDQTLRASLAAEVARLSEVQARVQDQAQRTAELQNHLDKARLILGAAQQKLDRCSDLAEERKRREADHQRLANERAILEELRLAFGKKGIQAMIIEAVIPEIEYEANKLLSRMTNGRMHVRFDTQRETLKGDTIETLEINIADELGTRPYELFSGGEAFRVNFAIRIALSKLLAHRAGAQLQMLVIDEGFGTQDAEGRERLIEAINSIQDDFARILVITHIEELRDVFPVRIEVIKTAGGSQINVG